MLSGVSFHYTKNITCGEGGALLFSETLEDEILPIVNKGTDRHLFDKRIVKKYNVSSFGSSHIMSEWNAAFLREQLINEKNITKQRQDQWVYYTWIKREI